MVSRRSASGWFDTRQSASGGFNTLAHPTPVVSHETTSRSPETALVTGAAGGVGRAVVERFRADGWRVYATDVESALDEADPWADDDGVVTAVLDVTDAADRERVRDRIATETGRLDSLANVAGYALPGAVLDTDETAVRELYDVLVHGPTALARTAFDLLRAGDGSVVTVTSSLARTVFPGTGHYAAAKAAAATTTDALRAECRGTGVSATTVEPAWVDTPFDERGLERLPPAADRHAAFAETYRRLERGRLLDGGLAAVSPERVARVVVHAATVERPRASYPVGWPAWGLRLVGHLPTPLLDAVRDTVAGAVTRVREWRE